MDASSEMSSIPDRVPSTHCVNVCHMLTEMTCLPVLTTAWKTFFKAASPGHQEMGQEEGERGGPIASLGPGDPHSLILHFFMFFLSASPHEGLTSQAMEGETRREKAVLWVSEAVSRAPQIPDLHWPSSWTQAHSSAWV